MTYNQRNVSFSTTIATYLYITCALDVSNDYMAENENHYGKPLYLTPYLISGNIFEARELSSVKNLPNAPQIISYSGFFTVNKTYNSNMFFWFVPAMNSNKSAPLLLWLQGGPGQSSLYGFFLEHGPYFLYPDMRATLRKYAWTKRFHMIYVDNPVGAGFSFTDSDEGYAQNQDQVSDNMYEFLQQFFFMFSEYQKNHFYVTGESYGGKYVPAVSYGIHKEGKKSKINFKGMAIGNGFSDPETMVPTLPEYLYQLGLIDRKQAKFMRNVSNSIVQLIRNEYYLQAAVESTKIMDTIGLSPNSSFFVKFTGYKFHYNYLFTEKPAEYAYFPIYLEIPDVRMALHVGKLQFQNGTIVKKSFLNDIMQSVKPKVTELMNNYRVLFYSGQLDLAVSYPATVNFLRSVKWKCAREYKDAKRQIWRLENSRNFIAGYVRNVCERFYEIFVRDVGHLVPHDQSEVAFDMISRFVNGDSYA